MYFDLPKELRPFLKNPYGTLYPGNGSEVIDQIRPLLSDAAGHDVPVVSVGDVTTYNLISAGIFPKLCLVDRLTKRLPVPEHISPASHSNYCDIRVKNPAGTISDEMVLAVQEALLSDSNIRICVDGEEDLASIPVIAFSKPGTLVLYGQPDEGMVVVTVTDAKNAEMTRFFRQILDVKNAKTAVDDVPADILSVEVDAFLKKVF
ncbi:GTP-dependent dephospho-CoA kinase family protein [Methanolapillus africanus]|uniref:GTP-dependent dephospho-CoA kinase family protein n=1 Tax=Methanolapillus africanus TaxID=3028297 RepID=UPI0030B88753